MFQKQKQKQKTGKCPEKDLNGIDKEFKKLTNLGR